jgi:hypothetical protein
VGPTAGLDNTENRKFLTLPGLELQPLSHYTDCDIPLLYVVICSHGSKYYVRIWSSGI